MKLAPDLTGLSSGLMNSALWVLISVCASLTLSSDDDLGVLTIESSRLSKWRHSWTVLETGHWPSSDILILIPVPFTIYIYILHTSCHTVTHVIRWVVARRRFLYSLHIPWCLSLHLQYSSHVLHLYRQIYRNHIPTEIPTSQVSHYYSPLNRGPTELTGPTRTDSLTESTGPSRHRI